MTNKRFVIETHSPYYLHPSNGPGALITAVIFDGKNYDLWEKAIRTSLRSKNKLGFIEGTVPKPTPTIGEDTTELQAWEMANSMVCSWILNVIDPKLRTSVAYVDTAALMWTHLKKRYSVSNAPKIHQLKTKLAESKQGGSEVVEFFSKLMGLWSELENQVRFPRCTCGKCECKIGEQLAKMVEEEKAHQFLMGLNDDVYASIRGQILAIEPLPSLDKIFSMVHQEESHKHMMLSRDDRAASATAFAINSGGGRARLNNREKGTCGHCGKYGHNEDGCFELIGYPPGWTSRGRGRGRGQRGGRGGRLSGMRDRGDVREGAHAVLANTATEPSISEQPTIPGLTTELVQW